MCTSNTEGYNMQILPINDQNTKQKAFNGTVHKSVTQYVKYNTKTAIKDVVKEANKKGEAVDKTTLINLKAKGDSILKRLKDYMLQLHPKTMLKCTVSNFSDESSIWMENTLTFFPIKKHCINSVDKTNDKIYVATEPIFGKHLSGDATLRTLNHLCNNLESIQPITIDEAMYETKMNGAKNAIKEHYESKSFFNFGLIKNFYKNNVLNFSKHFEKSDECRTELDSYTQKVIEEVTPQKQTAKQNRINNNKILKEILKEG